MSLRASHGLPGVDINVWAVAVAAASSFAASIGWYGVFGDLVARLQREWRGSSAEGEYPVVWQMLGFVASAVVIAVVVAVLVDRTGASGLADSAALGLLLWVGFCATQWVGSILGESVPVRLAAIHAVDWLLHLVIMSAIIGTWR